MYTNAKLSLVSISEENKVAFFADTNLWWPDYCLKAGGTQQVQMISRVSYLFLILVLKLSKKSIDIFQ